MNASIAISEIDFASLDLLPYGIIVLDAEGVVVFYNDREEQIAGRDRRDVLGRNFFTEVAPCTQIGGFYERFRKTISSEGITAEFSFHFPFQPQARDVEVAMTGFHVEGRVLCLVAVRDVTESELVRERILSSEKLAGVGEVAAGVAHNFNNLLMAVGTWVSVLKRESASASPRAQRAIAEISRMVSDGRSMVARIRADNLQSPENAAVEEVAINEIVRDAVDLARGRITAVMPDAKFDVDFSLANDLPAVDASAAELREVFLNLLSNAVESMNGRGHVSVETTFEEGQVRVAIRDFGPGMSEAVQQKIFRPLFSTKGVKGTGLGLATSYSTVRRLGGTLTFRSVLGEGTVFFVSLPPRDGAGALHSFASAH